MTSAIILAGGLGTRLRSAVPDLPKPMAPISGRPFLEHLLDYWIKQGISHFVLSVGYRYEVIIDHFGNSYKDVPLDYVIEEIPLGTGGGLLLAAEKVSQNEPFLLLNGDTYFAVDLKALIEFSLANDADWCFSLFRANEVGRYMGMDISPLGQITSLKSGTGQPGRLANGGVYWVNPRALFSGDFSPGDKLSLEDDIFLTAMTLGQRLLGIEFSGTFIDIGVPDDYYRAPALLLP
ncbi:MAG: sugar phosphate nucleotidyltransferase [Methylococcaceae bacterium]